MIIAPLSLVEESCRHRSICGKVKKLYEATGKQNRHFRKVSDHSQEVDVQRWASHYVTAQP
ncbi:MAG: hypothetical protein JWN34_6189 [Bryobacterales bacterium]|nr:hypothetical protein [Bryobacterales bacterium]